MKAFVFTGGNIRVENITEKPEADDIIIAADSGYNNALAMGLAPHLLVGDFDSLGKKNIPSGIKTVELPAEKDVTDTHVAIDAAIENGASQIVIIGGLDGRLDHTLSNLAILRDLFARNIYAVITDGVNRVRYIRSTSTLLARSRYKYFSLIADDEKVKGVDIEGGKYPLKNATILRRHQYAVSNEITGNCALIAVKKGGLFIIESDPQI
jgi:thiamine pyrophosphokinase